MYVVLQEVNTVNWLFSSFQAGTYRKRSRTVSPAALRLFVGKTLFTMFDQSNGIYIYIYQDCSAGTVWSAWGSSPLQNADSGIFAGMCGKINGDKKTSHRRFCCSLVANFQSCETKQKKKLLWPLSCVGFALRYLNTYLVVQQSICRPAFCFILKVTSFKGRSFRRLEATVGLLLKRWGGQPRTMILALPERTEQDHGRPKNVLLVSEPKFSQ
jgi:hypothetical protein